jgi:hypothetical protein
MTENEIDRQFRSETQERAAVSVRWEQVVRRRRRQRGLALLAVAIMATLALTGGLIAGRSALDPTFKPPIISKADVDAGISTPKYGREAVPSNALAAGAANSRVGSTRGFMIAATVESEGVEGQPLHPQWRLRRMGIDTATAWVPSTDSDVLGLKSDGETIATRQWLSLPRRSGLYIAELRLLDNNGRMIERTHGEPFDVVAADCCRPYEAESYIAEVPRGWRLRADYQAEEGGRFISEVVGPRGMSVLIDTTPRSSGNAAASQRSLEMLMRDSGEPYQRISLRRVEADGELQIEWSYRLSDRTYTDVLFYREGDGFGILGESPPSRLRETREYTRAVARSIDPH